MIMYYTTNPYINYVHFFVADKPSAITSWQVNIILVESTSQFRLALLSRIVRTTLSETFHTE